MNFDPLNPKALVFQITSKVALIFNLIEVTLIFVFKISLLKLITVSLLGTD